MFDQQQQPLPSDYGSPGGDPPSLSPLAAGEGALPREYGTSTKADTAPKQRDISDFVKGVTTAVEQSGIVPTTFQSSGKAATATEPAEPAASDASKKWKVAAALAVGTLVVGGTLWYGSKQGWFTPKEAP